MGMKPRKTPDRPIYAQYALVDYYPNTDHFVALEWARSASPSNGRGWTRVDERGTSGPQCVAMIMRREDFEAREREGRTSDVSTGEVV